MQILAEIQKGEHRCNQSRLKLLLKEKPYKYYQDDTKSSRAQEFGQVVEALVFTGASIYDVLETNVTESARECAQWLFDKTFTLMDHNILLWCREVNFGNNWKPVTKVSKLEEGGLRAYFDLLSSGRIILTPDEDKEAQALAAAVLHKTPLRDMLDKEHVFQKYVEFDYRGTPCKGTYDMFLPKENQIVDLKVISEPIRKSARKYRWDIQGAFYYEPVDGPLPVFIVARRYAPNNPLTLTMTGSDLTTGKFGITTYIETSAGQMKRVDEGFHDLIERFKWHRDQALWDYPMEYYLNESTQPLNVFS